MPHVKKITAVGHLIFWSAAILEAEWGRGGGINASAGMIGSIESYHASNMVQDSISESCHLRGHARDRLWPHDVKPQSLAVGRSGRSLFAIGNYRFWVG